MVTTELDPEKQAGSRKAQWVETVGCDPHLTHRGVVPGLVCHNPCAISTCHIDPVRVYDTLDSMGDLLGYARVSTQDQDASLQLDALKAAGCIKVFTDKASGSLDRRPQLDRLLDQLRPGDTVVVWRLDRLGRSLKHLIQLIEDLAEKGVGFRSLTEGMDTTTAGGQAHLLDLRRTGRVRAVPDS